MTVSTTLVKTVVLVLMASTTSRVTALKGILGVIPRQFFRGIYLMILQTILPARLNNKTLHTLYSITFQTSTTVLITHV